MKLNYKTIVLSLPLLFAGCATEECPQGLEKLPLYGGVQKCEDQIRADFDFVKNANQQFSSLESAAKYYVGLGQAKYNENKNDSSMILFNLALLLDSTNADIYAGYGNLLGRKGEFEKSVPYFEKSLSINTKNSKVWESISNSYGLWYQQTNKPEILDKAIACLKYSLSLDSSNVRGYAQLTALYTYFIKKDSALKYLAITDKLDSGAVNPKVRAILITKENTKE